MSAYPILGRFLFLSNSSLYFFSLLFCIMNRVAFHLIAWWIRLVCKKKRTYMNEIISWYVLTSETFTKRDSSKRHNLIFTRRNIYTVITMKGGGNRFKQVTNKILFFWPSLEGKWNVQRLFIYFILFFFKNFQKTDVTIFISKSYCRLIFKAIYFITNTENFLFCLRIVNNISPTNFLRISM